jgi:hypothetical protein
MAAMGTSARAAGSDQWLCEKCGGAYVVEGPRDRARKRLRCSECGYGEEAWIVPAQNGRYTLVDPTGAVVTAPTWQELTGLIPSASAESVVAPTAPADEVSADVEQKPPSKFPSATALLDLTPSISLSRVEPKLTLVMGGGDKARVAHDVDPPLAAPIATPAIADAPLEHDASAAPAEGASAPTSDDGAEPI